MKLHFCTLFDINYLERGLVLYESLEEVCKDFIIYIIAMDKMCYDILTKMNLSKAEIIFIDNIEYKELKEAKDNRSFRAFCWTCSSWGLKYIFDTYNPYVCTYLDADEYFYSSPEKLIDGFVKSDANAAIIGHNFGDERYARIMRERSGTYCVQFNSFKRNSAGLRILNDWCMDCANECTDYFDGKRFGDQKYLDNWVEKYDKVYIYTEIGAGVAPWNIYRFRRAKNKLEDENKYLFDLISKKNWELFFIHYHSLIITDEYADISVFTRYGRHDKRIIYRYYKGYIKKVIEIRSKIEEAYPDMKSQVGIREHIRTGEKKSIINKMIDYGIMYYLYGAIKHRLYKKLDYVNVNNI